MTNYLHWVIFTYKQIGQEKAGVQEWMLTCDQKKNMTYIKVGDREATMLG